MARTYFRAFDEQLFGDRVGLMGLLGYAPGSIYYVHSGTGKATASGTSRSDPLTTINLAVAKCSNSQADVVCVMPGHNESLTAATSCVLNKIGMAVIGFGAGRNRPVLDFDNTAASIEIDAASVVFKNFVLKTSVVDLVVGVNVDADDVEIANIETTYEASGDCWLVMIDVDAVDRTYIHDCVFNTEPATGGCDRALRFDDNEQTRVIDNLFNGNFEDAAIVGEGAAGKNMVLANNVIYNADVSAVNGIDFGVATTGIAFGNTIGVLYPSPITSVFDTGSFLCHSNFCMNAIDETGIVQPGTTPA